MLHLAECVSSCCAFSMARRRDARFYIRAPHAHGDQRLFICIVHSIEHISISYSFHSLWVCRKPHRLFAKTHDKRPLQRIMLKNGKSFLDYFAHARP